MRHCRRFITGTILFIATAAAPPALADPPALDFVILRNGKELGWQKVWLHREGPLLDVEVRSQAEFKIGSLVLYRFAMRRTEHWMDGRLMAFSAWTNDDGKIMEVNGQREGEVFRVTGPDGVTTIPGHALPGNFWNYELTRATLMIDNDNGRVVPITVIPGETETIDACGGTMQARRYRIIGKETHDVWYDATGRWVRSQFDARDLSRIEIVLRGAAPIYLALSGERACG